jgi:hypothetical protein
VRTSADQLYETDLPEIQADAKPTHDGVIGTVRLIPDNGEPKIELFGGLAALLMLWTAPLPASRCAKLLRCQLMNRQGGAIHGED